MYYKLIADAGSTNIQWIVTDADGTPVCTARTGGVNAALCDMGRLRDAFAAAAAETGLPGPVDTVYYYGAGCADKTLCDNVRKALLDAFRAARAEVHSDLLAAARATLGDSAGIACILGTGSNSGLYDGTAITDNVPPLGFILGDEGSGAALGRRLLNGIFKRGLSSATVRDDFFRSFPTLDAAAVIGRVYRDVAPSRFLASFAPFILKHIATPEIHDMVVGEFRTFLERNLIYPGRDSLPVWFTGGVASNFSTQLREACEACGVSMAGTVESPAQGLADYHRKHLHAT